MPENMRRGRPKVGEGTGRRHQISLTDEQWAYFEDIDRWSTSRAVRNHLYILHDTLTDLMVHVSNARGDADASPLIKTEMRRAMRKILKLRRKLPSPHQEDRTTAQRNKTQGRLD